MFEFFYKILNIIFYFIIWSRGKFKKKSWLGYWIATCTLIGSETKWPFKILFIFLINSRFWRECPETIQSTHTPTYSCHCFWKLPGICGDFPNPTVSKLRFKQSGNRNNGNTAISSNKYGQNGNRRIIAYCWRGSKFIKSIWRVLSSKINAKE